ncbi:MAG: hypothetical protein WKG00_23810 [Polyangiaceae bacterium]
MNVLRRAAIAAAFVLCAGIAGCRCECGAGSGGTPSTPSVHNVSTSAECDAVCKRIEACGARCDRDERCKIERGKCPASKRALLQCEATKGTFTCLPPSGFTVASGCNEDEALCTGADAETTRVPPTP